jgi:hypothetical protein
MATAEMYGAGLPHLSNSEQKNGQRGLEKKIYIVL